MQLYEDNTIVHIGVDVGHQRPLADRMTVEAARMLQDLAGLAEQRDRTRPCCAA